MIGAGLTDPLDGGKVDLESGAVKSGLIQILRCTHKGARPTTNSADKRLEVSTGFWGEEDQYLPRILWDRDLQPFAAFMIPCLRREEPVFRRRVCRATQKGRHKKIMHGLPWGEICFDRHLIASRKIGYLGDRQGLPCMNHFYFQRGPCQIERCRISEYQARYKEEKKKAGNAQKRSHNKSLTLRVVAGQTCLSDSIPPFTPAAT